MEEKMYENARIVIVDDVEEVLRSTKNCLEFEGMKVKCFSSPIEGLEYLKYNKDDVLLLDFFMPEMNGDKFVSELRKYNEETIVILQTGYSDKIPPLEMIDKMNIQGYLDKMKGEDELVLMTKSAVKTSFLNKKIREKDRQISILNYKNAIIGDLISHLVNESKDQLFQISAMNKAIKDDTNVYLQENEVIKSATDKIYELYEALNFENKDNMNVSQFEKTIKELLKAKLLVNNINLLFKLKNSSIVIEANVSKLIYLILKIVDLMIELNTKEILIEVAEEENRKCFKVNTDINCDSIEIEELNLIKENANIEIKKQKNSIVIKI